MHTHYVHNHLSMCCSKYLDSFSYNCPGMLSYNRQNNKHSNHSDIHNYIPSHSGSRGHEKGMAFGLAR